VSNAAYRYRARFTMHAPASAVAALVTPTSGLVEAIDDERCHLYTGSNALDALALYVALIGVDFEVDEPPELVDRIRLLADRLHRATP
jgi:predicted DNA-binding transcriptional regulator YafY